ncbi:MAG: LytR/AlgR family response regulator transcription factor [Giesbergeria sp.]
MNILVIDDEALARKRLATLLADCGAMPPHRVTEAASSAEALALLMPSDGRGFDMLLLDIHMPGLDGLTLAHRVCAMAWAPAIVFVTAHTEHALSAFELDAVDYLTKPVRLARLQQALSKVQRLRELAGHAGSAPVQPKSPGESLLIQDLGRTERVPLAEVLVCKAELKYVTVRTAARSYVLDSTLAELETRHADHLMRVHRNALVARRAVRALEKHFDAEEGEGWAVRLAGLAEPIMVSRRQVAAVREAIADS